MSKLCTDLAELKVELNFVEGSKEAASIYYEAVIKENRQLHESHDSAKTAHETLIKILKERESEAGIILAEMKKRHETAKEEEEKLRTSALRYSEANKVLISEIEDITQKNKEMEMLIANLVSAMKGCEGFLPVLPAC